MKSGRILLRKDVCNMEKPKSTFSAETLIPLSFAITLLAFAYFAGGAMTDIKHNAESNTQTDARMEKYVSDINDNIGRITNALINQNVAINY